MIAQDSQIQRIGSYDPPAAGVCRRRGAKNGGASLPRLPPRLGWRSAKNLPLAYPSKVIHQPVDIFVNNVRTKHETFLLEAYGGKVENLRPPKLTL